MELRRLHATIERELYDHLLKSGKFGPKWDEWVSQALISQLEKETGIIKSMGSSDSHD